MSGFFCVQKSRKRLGIKNLNNGPMVKLVITSDC